MQLLPIKRAGASKFHSLLDLGSFLTFEGRSSLSLAYERLVAPNIRDRV
jgi:hypothetical protein